MAGIKMDLDEEIFLADTTDSSDIFFAEDSSIVSQEIQETVNEDSSEVDEIYNLLKISEKPERVDFKEYFKSNPEIFKIVGVDYYKTITPEQYAQFEKKCEKLIVQAKEIWNSPKLNYKIAELDDALGTLKSVFRSENATKAYSSEIKRTLNEHLNSAFKQKIKDGILEVSEISELIEIAISIHLISDSDNGKKALLDLIKDAQKKIQFIIEPFSDTFINLVKKKSKIERLNTDETKQMLFSEYLKLAELDNKINSNGISIDKQTLYTQMYNLLFQNNVLIDNISLYKDSFFDLEKSSGKYNFSLPLNDEYFYYLKGTAIHTYQFSESQWTEFRNKNGIHKIDDVSVAFIMGTEKASTISGIADLLEDNPNMALSRIRAGDVETYLSHIGQLEKAKKLTNIKEALKNDADNLVQAVVDLLRGIDSKNGQIEEEVSQSDSLLPLIEVKASPQELVSYLLRRKQFENLNKKILSNTKDHREFENYLLSIGFSFLKICMNYLHLFPLESDALAYKHMYEKYADYVLSELDSENDFMVFLYVFKPIIDEIAKGCYLSDNFIEKYNEIEKQMIKKLDEKKTENKQNEKKPKIPFFRFKK